MTVTSTDGSPKITAWRPEPEGMGPVGIWQARASVVGNGTGGLAICQIVLDKIGANYGYSLEAVGIKEAGVNPGPLLLTHLPGLTGSGGAYGDLEFYRGVNMVQQLAGLGVCVPDDISVLADGYLGMHTPIYPDLVSTARPLIEADMDNTVALTAFKLSAWGYLYSRRGITQGVVATAPPGAQPGAAGGTFAGVGATGGGGGGVRKIV